MSAKTKRNSISRSITNELENEKRKVREIISWIIFGVIAVILGFVLVIKLIFPAHSVPILGFRAFLIANTRSMEPMFSYNDLVIVTGYDFDNLEIGDVVAFDTVAVISGNSVNITVAHVIYDAVYAEVTDELIGFITTGINDNVGLDMRILTVDGANNTNRFTGIVSWHSTGLGHVLRFLMSPIGIILIIVNTTLIIMTSIYNRHVKIEDDYFIDLELQLIEKHEELENEKLALKNAEAAKDEELRMYQNSLEEKKEELEQFSKNLKITYEELANVKGELQAQEMQIKAATEALRKRERHLQKMSRNGMIGNNLTEFE